MDKEKKRTCRQETQPSHFFCGVPRVPADCIRGCFFFYTGRRCRCSWEQACGFPVFLLLPCSRLSSVAKALPYSALAFFVFPESGAPTGGSSPGQLQMRNSWPPALAAAQIRPFEKITVLLPPRPPPVGHARSAEGRGMCRRASERGAPGGPRPIRPFSQTFSHCFSPLQCFNASCTKPAVDCSQIKPDRVFSISPKAVWHCPVEPPPSPARLLVACFCFLGTGDEWSIDGAKAHSGTAAGYLC